MKKQAIHYITYCFHGSQYHRTFQWNRNSSTAVMIFVNKQFNGFTSADCSLTKSLLELLPTLEQGSHLTSVNLWSFLTVTLNDFSRNLTFFCCTLNSSSTLRNSKDVKTDQILEINGANATGKFKDLSMYCLVMILYASCTHRRFSDSCISWIL